MIDLNELHYGIKMDDDGAYEQLEELVSLRKPKRVVYSGRAFVSPCCPRCQHSYDFDDFQWNFCPHCGQALDWSKA